MAGAMAGSFGQRNTSDSEGLRVRINGGQDAAAAARAKLSRLRSDLDPPLLENVRLLVTELITNAVRHAGADALDLTVLVASTRVHVEVSNPGGTFEPRASAADSGDAGWGLFLVDRLSDDWGVVEDDEGRQQRVWFELARA